MAATPVALSAAHWRFLLIDQCLGSTLVNAALNAAIAWFAFDRVQGVWLWGASGIAVDTVATAFMLPAVTSVITTWIVARRVQRGRLGPPGGAHGPLDRLARQTSLRRAGLFGAAGVGFAAGPVVLVFALLGPSFVPWPTFFVFKVGFAALLAAVVTPAIGWCALIAAVKIK